MQKLNKITAHTEWSGIPRWHTSNSSSSRKRLVRWKWFHVELPPSRPHHQKERKRKKERANGCKHSARRQLPKQQQQQQRKRCTAEKVVGSLLHTHSLTHSFSLVSCEHSFDCTCAAKHNYLNNSIKCLDDVTSVCFCCCCWWCCWAHYCLPVWLKVDWLNCTLIATLSIIQQVIYLACWSKASSAVAAAVFFSECPFCHCHQRHVYSHHHQHHLTKKKSMWLYLPFFSWVAML